MQKWLVDAIHPFFDVKLSFVLTCSANTPGKRGHSSNYAPQSTPVKREFTEQDMISGRQKYSDLAREVRLTTLFLVHTMITMVT